MIDRRTFVAGLGIALATRASAQTPRGLPRVGFLHPASAEGSVVYQKLVPGLAQLGYVDGKTVRLELRSAGGVPALIPTMVDELLAAKVDVLLVVGPATVKAAAAATTKTTAIVAIDLESDPVAAGWMRSLSRPGGNVTGFFLDAVGMSAKWLQLLRESAPRAREIGLLWDTGSGQAQLAATRAAAADIGVRAQTVPVENWNVFEPAATAALHGGRAQALVVLSSPNAFQASTRFAAFTLRNRVPAITPFRSFAAAGGLISYGPDLDVFFGRTAGMIDKVLRGAKPSDLAVEQPAKYELVVNEATGRALGLALPKSLLLGADEVIR